MVEILMGEARRYLHAGRMLVTGERLTARASPGRWGSQVPYTVDTVVETTGASN